MNSHRQRGKVSVVSKGMNLRALIRLVDAGEYVGILNDQDAGRNGTFISFMGRPASTHIGAVKIAAKKKVPVVPVFLERISTLRYLIVIHEPVFPEGKDNINLSESLQVYANCLEEHIKRRPEQWLWVHRRWKSRPKK